MKNLLLITFIVLLSSLSCKAQEKVTGTLPGWENGTADVIMGFTKPFVIGSVNESGEFEIPLTDDILAKTKEGMEAHNSSSSSGKFGLNSLKKAFSCSDDSALTVIGGDQQPVTLTTFGAISIGSMEKKKMYGSMMTANSRAFAEAFQSYGEKDAVKGFYMNWYFVEQPASVEGTCPVKAYALNQKDLYDKKLVYQLDFKKGWNAVKISLDEIYTDSDGKTYASKWTYQTVDEMPKETEFVYFKE
jgi:hypothetical protein